MKYIATYRTPEFFMSEDDMSSFEPWEIMI